MTTPPQPEPREASNIEERTAWAVAHGWRSIGIRKGELTGIAPGDPWRDSHLAAVPIVTPPNTLELEPREADAAIAQPTDLKAQIDSVLSAHIADGMLVASYTNLLARLAQLVADEIAADRARCVKVAGNINAVTIGEMAMVSKEAARKNSLSWTRHDWMYEVLLAFIRTREVEPIAVALAEARREIAELQRANLDLLHKVKAAERERDDIQQRLDHAAFEAHRCDSLEIERDTFRERVGVLEAALTYYADEKHHMVNVVGGARSAYFGDYGERARAALVPSAPEVGKDA